MSYTPNVALRRALLERLKSIGMCADLRNDQIAVKAAAEQLGLKLEEAERELSQMRMEHSAIMFRSYGQTQMPKRFLASSLRAQLRSRANSAFDDQRARSQSMTQDLIADLDGFDTLQQNEAGEEGSGGREFELGSHAWLERMRQHPEFLGDRELEARHP
jgi:hypothetical protein